MKYISYALGLAVLAAAPMALNGAEITASGGEIVRGVWNSRFSAAKQYADANHIPLIVFYGKSDCSQCQKLKNALGTDEFINWQNEKQYVQVLSIKYSAPDWETARAFIKSSPLNSDDLPMICVYWNKEDGTVIRKAFVGRSGKMPSSTGSTLQAKFINSVESVLSSGGTVPPSPTPTPPTPPQPLDASAFFSSAKTVSLVAVDETGAFAGFVQVKAGKANARTHMARISATVQLLGFKLLRFASRSFNVSTTANYGLSNASGVLVLECDGSALSGTVTQSGKTFQLVSGVKLGGAMPTAKSKFSLLNPPQKYRDFDIFTEWLPIGQEFSTGARWTFPKKGAVRYNRATGEFVNAGADTNASGLKLTYTSTTGYFKGTFIVYYKSSAARAGKVTAQVVGYVVDGVGQGTATIPAVGTFDVTITAP